ncbi:DNA polymerase IV [Aeribacillus sp. FSL K6-8394]|nr:DNA polymerase IV [Aeribacillus pallidus]
MMCMSRVILHIDMNSFYASVEAAFDPSLKGLPLAIAGNPEERKGIVVTCSYEARAFGVKTTMPVWEAKKLCPNLIVKKPRFDRYRKASKAMFAILSSYTPIVEPVSIDEGYMDVTDVARHPLDLAKEIQQRLLDELELPSSIGIAPNKFLAKTASDMKKPLGITVLRKRDIKEKLWPLDVEEMHGVGAKTAEKLKKIGIRTIGDLARGNDVQLEKIIGINGLRLKEKANGIDHRPVDPSSVYDFKSVGNQMTLPEDATNEEELKNALKSLAKSVSLRLKKKEAVATKVAVMLRYKDRTTVTKSMKLENPTDDERTIFQHALIVFQKLWKNEPVRLLGITGQDVMHKKNAFKQLDLFTFEEEAKNEPLHQAIEKLSEKYGEGIIKKGLSMHKEIDSFGSSFGKDFFFK